MKTKNWMTLNQHGKQCLKTFLYAISAGDIRQVSEVHIFSKNGVQIIMSSGRSYLLTKKAASKVLNYTES